ncbi:hypothetical protein F5878DRAFT_40437 [Lentinula raphanica]|uniref:Zn(2)-C6 fungal-type domain-containing protein n=1 Tax=Lentinula raphanica TaxID=153919 RepID=A0AA38PE64_9AGAR|nr:hypothetical protein F5878DRAFT_40437 [Lentinula raphanica]
MSSQQDNSSAQQQVDTPRAPRRTPMACQFCRGNLGSIAPGAGSTYSSSPLLGRKLKCDGNRPSCGNCDRRGYPCEYTPVSAEKK